MSDQLSLPERLAATFPDLRYIWVTRRHKVRQAVSLFRAEQTGSWKLHTGQQTEGRELSFNAQIIDQYLRQIVRGEAAWAEYFASSQIVPCTVVYEDLVLDYERTVRRVLEYLQIELPAGYVFPAPRLQRQADALSEEWIQRYEQSMNRRHGYQRLVNLPFLLSNPSLRRAFITPRVRAQRTKIIRGVRQHLPD